MIPDPSAYTLSRSLIRVTTNVRRATERRAGNAR